MATITETNSPLFFGHEGSTPQQTLITNRPMEISKADFEAICTVTQRVARYINVFSLAGRAQSLGVSENLMENMIEFDQDVEGKMIFGGLDLYRDPNLGFKILEINPRVQAMGLQDYRLKYLGIADQPTMINHFMESLAKDGYKKALVLGSRQNPFWRAHERITDLLNKYGLESVYSDTQAFDSCYQGGFVPDVVIRFCSSEFLLYHESAISLRQFMLDRKVPVINTISSTFFGSRGFLKIIEQDMPELLPKQIDLKSVEDAEDIIKTYPWIKLDAGTFSYVVNISELRKWGRGALLSLLKGDKTRFNQALDGRISGDAIKLQDAAKAIDKTTPDQIKWIAQEAVKPQEVTLPIDGYPADLKILHRAYWVQNGDQIDVSIEGFGCTKEQYSASKGKINAGSGIAVPMVVV